MPAPLTPPAPPGFLSPAAFPFPNGPYQLPNDAPPANAPYMIGALEGRGALSSWTVTITAPSAPGDTIAVFAIAPNTGNTLTSLSDSRGNSYSKTQLPAGQFSVQGGQFTAVNPVPLQPGDTVTTTWSSGVLPVFLVVGVPAASVGSPGGYMVPDVAVLGGTASSTYLSRSVLASALASPQEVALVCAVLFVPSGSPLALNWSPDWPLIGSTSSLNPASGNGVQGSAGYKILSSKQSLNPSFLLSAIPASSMVFVSTFMLETRFAPKSPPDMPPGMQSPGAWQYAPLGRPPEGPATTKYSGSPYKFTEALPAGTASHGTVTRTTGKQIPAAARPAGVLGKGTAKLLAVTAHPAGVLLKAAAKRLAAAARPAAALLKGTAKHLAVTAHPAGVLARAAAKRLAAATAAAAGIVRARTKLLAARVTAAARLIMPGRIPLYRFGAAIWRWVFGSARNH